MASKKALTFSCAVQLKPPAGVKVVVGSGFEPEKA